MKYFSLVLLIAFLILGYSFKSALPSEITISEADKIVNEFALQMTKITQKEIGNSGYEEAKKDILSIFEKKAKVHNDVQFFIPDKKEITTPLEIFKYVSTVTGLKRQISYINRIDRKLRSIEKGDNYFVVISQKISNTKVLEDSLVFSLSKRHDKINIRKITKYIDSDNDGFERHEDLCDFEKGVYSNFGCPVDSAKIKIEEIIVGDGGDIQGGGKDLPPSPTISDAEPKITITKPKDFEQVLNKLVKEFEDSTQFKSEAKIIEEFYSGPHKEFGKMIYDAYNEGRANRGENWRDDTAEMIAIKSAKFTLGCEHNDCDSDNKNTVEIELSNFLANTFLVTNEQYAEFLTNYEGTFYSHETNNEVRTKNSELFEDGLPLIFLKDASIDKKDNLYVAAMNDRSKPVHHVTWYGAKEFAHFYGLELPSEAQWEYMYELNRALSPSFDLFDFDEGYSEWCEDSYDSNIFEDFAYDSKWKKDPCYYGDLSDNKVIRGKNENIRTPINPKTTASVISFRCVISPKAADD